MTELEETIEAIESVFGPVTVTTKRSELYPDWRNLRVVIPFTITRADDNG